MITMTQIDEIKRLKDKEGYGFRKIARITGLDRKTVSKWYKSKSFPKYYRKNNKTPIKDIILPYINSWIEEDIQLISKHKKHRIRTASCIWADLQRMNILCGESTVRKYVSELKPKKVYIPLEYDPGEDMQVDWGVLPITFENNITIKVNIFVATLPYSNTRFAYPYFNATQSAFFDGHIKAFHFFGGIPEKITYDNLSSAVKRILKGIDREEQDMMMHFKNFYNFQTNYCAPAKANEKGSVENGVGYVKRRYLSSSHIFKDFRELREYLVKRCTEDMEKMHYKKRVRIQELLDEEQGYFKVLPDFDLETADIIKTKSNSRLLVNYDGVGYSIPCEYSQKDIVIKATPEEIIIYTTRYQDAEIARYERTHKAFTTEVYDFRHYLPVLLQKSRAVDKAACLKKSNLPSICWDYLKGLQSKQLNGNREFVRILLLHKQYPMKDIYFAIEWCYHHRSFSYDAIILTLQALNSRIHPKEEITKDYPIVQDVSINLKQYDNLLGETTV